MKNRRSTKSNPKNIRATINHTVYYKTILTSLFLLFGIGIFLYASQKSQKIQSRAYVAGENTTSNPLTNPPPGYTWKMTFNDEFNGQTIDKNKWYQWETHVDDNRLYRPQDSYLDGNGNLIIQTVQTTYNGKNMYTASSVASTGKFEQKYGYFESKVLLPNKTGVVPSFWLHTFNMEADIPNSCCEIDVFEQLGRNDKFQTTIHWGGYGTNHGWVDAQFLNKGVLNGWHTFGLWWKADEYIFYLDGVEFWRTNANGHVSQVPQFVWLSQYPNNWAGNIDPRQVPAIFKVDYVRIYELNAVSPTPIATITPKATSTVTPFSTPTPFYTKTPTPTITKSPKPIITIKKTPTPISIRRQPSPTTTSILKPLIRATPKTVSKNPEETKTNNQWFTQILNSLIKRLNRDK